MKLTTNEKNFLSFKKNMLLQNHKNIKLYDARPLVNIHHVLMKNDNSLNKLKHLSNSKNLTFVKETPLNVFDNEFHKLPYKCYLCVQQDEIRGGLFDFQDIDTNNKYSIDISQGLIVILSPKIVLVRKQNIQSGERTLVLIK